MAATQIRTVATLSATPPTRNQSASLNEAGTTLTLLHEVLCDLDRLNIRFCYWKSSRRIRAVLAGEADLDLLVARSDRERFESILLERNFKLFPSVASRDHPAILSFLGYDEPSGQLVHLHVHFRLVIGAPLFKNHQLPWEEVILSHAIQHPDLPLRLLDPATEAVLLVVRASLELPRFDPIILRHRRAMWRKFALDQAALATSVDRTSMRNRAADLLGEDLADTVVDAFCGGRMLQRERLLHRRIERRLAPYRTYAAVEARLRGTARSLCWIAGSLNKRILRAPRPWSRRVPGGGRIIAVVGVDGSGKTSVTAAIRKWLASEVDVIPIYFGTGAGRPSLLLFPLKLALPLFTRLFATKPVGASHGPMSGRAAGPLYSVLLMIWATMVAVERRMKLLAARRGANRGLVVLTDRYPQDEIADFNDGPLLPRVKIAPAWLRRFEASVYTLAGRLPPDLVIKLRATPNTLALREPDMNPAILRKRAGQIDSLTFSSVRVVGVDAEQPLADVIRAVKSEIWSLL
jgi:hypothetical protein